MKQLKILFTFFTLLLLTGCATSKQSGKSEDIVKYATRFLHTPYRSGGTAPNGFDCSGFVQFVYKKFGYNLPRTSNEQMQQGFNVKNNDLKQGDLVFFINGNKNTTKAGHVGIITKIGKNGRFQFIHASNSGVRIDDSELSYYKSRYLKAKRIIR